jgi:hypothetical protein
MSVITIPINTGSIDGYDLFLKCKSLPKYEVNGNIFYTDEKSYQYVFGGDSVSKCKLINNGIAFDYQKYVVDKALERERYAAFLDCGLGKTIIELMFVHSVIESIGGKGLILCPLSVLEDVQRECERLYGYRMSNLRKDKWETSIAIVNFENRRHIDTKDLVCVVLDESSILKSGDGEICNYLMDLVKNVKFRLACSATPSPNDQTEYASHAVWLGVSSTLKEFYSHFFVKDGTEWRMKRHAKDAFYEFLKSWCCYIHSPSSLGFECGGELKEEPNYIIQSSFLPKYNKEGTFLSTSVSLSDSSKLFGALRADTTTERFKNAIYAIENRHSIIWCSRNAEEDAFRKQLNATVINGSTPIEKRVEIIDNFKSGKIKHLVSKPSVLGFGVNIQEADCHLYSGYTFSFEQFYQAVRRSHRFGRVGRLDVIVPVSEPERPVWDALQEKIKTFKNDVKELQSRFF